MPKALDQIQVEIETTTGKNGHQSALHPSRIEKMIFVRYTSPPENFHDRAEYDMWLESINYLCDDLHWLMQQPHDKFWCQTVFDESLHQALDSFLKHCPRSPDSLTSLPEGGRSRHLELCRLVFMTFLRMSTHKESKDHFLTPSVFGDILYENFLFDIPKLMDMCALFGKSNGQLLNKMISNIFTQQPKYMDDLKETVESVKHVFDNIAIKCGVKTESESLSPLKLEPTSGKISLSSMKEDELLDILLYLSDTAVTVYRFLDIYSPACLVFHQADFCSSIAVIYETVIPELTSALKQYDNTNDNNKKRFRSLLNCTKKSLLSAFHLILSHKCFQVILENPLDEEVVKSSVEAFLHTLTSVLNERQFLAGYEGMFSFRDDMDLLLQASDFIDSSQFDYIQSAINSAFATFGHRKSPRGNTNTGGRTSPDGAVDSIDVGASAVSAPPVSAVLSRQYELEGARPKTKAPVKTEMNSSSRSSSSPGTKSENNELGSASLPDPSDIEIESLIFAVKDILPHLGDGFVESALKEFGWNPESVISSVLEGSLPPALESVGMDAPRQPRAVNQGDGQTDNTSLLDSRRNVFDNDEFDVYRQKSVDPSKVHKGKKNDNVDLDDKSIVQSFKEVYDAYGSIDQESIYDTRQMYDDEYDDTYDTTNVGADDADSADELTNKVRLPRVLQDIERSKAKNAMISNRYDKGEYDDDDDNDNEEVDRRESQRRENFCEDPAKMRERREQQWQSQAGRGRRGGGGGGPPRTRDVVGKAKGQGQTKEVQNNRKAKEKFKGHRAQADRKMGKGMF